jgi:hypothetical protein
VAQREQRSAQTPSAAIRSSKRIALTGKVPKSGARSDTILRASGLHPKDRSEAPFFSFKTRKAAVDWEYHLRSDPKGKQGAERTPVRGGWALMRREAQVARAFTTRRHLNERAVVYAQKTRVVGPKRKARPTPPEAPSVRSKTSHTHSPSKEVAVMSPSQPLSVSERKRVCRAFRYSLHAHPALHLRRRVRAKKKSRVICVFEKIVSQ